MRELDEFTRSYLETALWSSHDESTPEVIVPFDQNHDIQDFAESALDRAISDCADFQERCAPLLRDGLINRKNYHGDSSAISLAGYEFWLTRNGHGAGFGDGNFVDPVDDWLREASKRYRETDPYLGDDGRIYFS